MLPLFLYCQAMETVLINTDGPIKRRNSGGKHMKIRKSITGILLILGLILVGGFDVAAQSETEDLKDQIKALQMRIEQLENQQRRPSQRIVPDYRDAFDQLDRIEREMNELFSNPSFFDRSDYLSTLRENKFLNQDFELKENKNAYFLELDIKGLNKEKIKVDVNNYSITLSGEYSTMSEEASYQSFFKQESFGSFTKTIPLPSDADITKMETKMGNDLLIISLPKK